VGLNFFTALKEKKRMLLGRNYDGSGVNAAEYSVYIYHYPAWKEADIHNWERKNTTTDKSEAIREAQELYASRDFQKVEVKKKFFHSRHQCMIDQTLRVYGEGAEASLKPAVFAILLVFAALAAGAAHALF
jgi:hypothetical protein